MGYLKRLSDSSFKTDRDGNTIFFPWGIIGKGYVVPDKRTENKIRKFAIWYQFVGLTFLFIVGVLLGLWIIGLFMLPVAFFVWWLQVKRFVKGLQLSDEKLSYKENIRKMFGRDSS